MTDKFDIEEQLKYAIIEHGAIRHLEEYEERKNRLKRIRRISFSSAATVLLLAACVGGGIETNRCKTAGNEENVEENAKGGGVVVALMREGNNREALRQINAIRNELESCSEQPENEWDLYERQELDYLEAVCLLRRGRFISGRRALKGIIQQEGYFSERAQGLLEKL